jgi:integrase
MPRTAGSKNATANLQRVESRDKLPPRPSGQAYWISISKGCYLGFRPSTLASASKGAGTWIAKYNDTATGAKPTTTLGAFDNLPGSERYGAAKKAADAWFKKLASGGSAESIDVTEACRRYAKGKDDAEARFQRHVYGDPLARVQLDKLQPHHVQDWRKRLEAKPAIVGAHKDRASSPTRERSPASINRDMVPLRAALNQAMDGGHVQTDTAWSKALRPVKATGRRKLYLSGDQRRALVAEMPFDIAAFCRALCRIPLRPGALAALRVRDFDARTRELSIGTDKEGAGRTVVLPADTAELFKAQARGKLPAAFLFARADGRAWDKEMWKGPIKAAAEAAGLPSETVAYTLRHSVLTDLVTGGLDLFTAAALAGTSVAMIEKYYGHLQKGHAESALSRLSAV